MINNKLLKFKENTNPIIIKFIYDVLIIDPK